MTLHRTMAALREGPLSESTGAQLYVSLHGQVLLDTAVGHAAAGRPMTEQTRLRWMCCSMALTVLAVLDVLDEASIAADAPLRRFLPEYGAAEVTLEHLLTHTVPYRSWGIRLLPDGQITPDDDVLHALPVPEALKLVCAEPLSAAPGIQAVYTSFASWQLLAETAVRISGLPFDDLIRTRVMRPLGMSASTPVVADAEDAAHLGRMYDCTGDQPLLEPFELTDAHAAAFSGRGPVSDLALLMECVLNAGEGRHGRVIRPATAHAMTRHRRSGLPDAAFGGLDVTWGLGLCSDPLVFGAPAGTRVIGQIGEPASFTFADLDRGLVVAHVANGRYGQASDIARKIKLVKSLYGDLREAEAIRG